MNEPHRSTDVCQGAETDTYSQVNLNGASIFRNVRYFDVPVRQCVTTTLLETKRAGNGNVRDLRSAQPRAHTVGGYRRFGRTCCCNHTVPKPQYEEATSSCAVGCPAQPNRTSAVPLCSNCVSSLNVAIPLSSSVLLKRAAGQ